MDEAGLLIALEARADLCRAEWRTGEGDRRWWAGIIGPLCHELAQPRARPFQAQFLALGLTGSWPAPALDAAIRGVLKDWSVPYPRAMMIVLAGVVAHPDTPSMRWPHEIEAIWSGMLGPPAIEIHLSPALPHLLDEEAQAAWVVRIVPPAANAPKRTREGVWRDGVAPAVNYVWPVARQLDLRFSVLALSGTDGMRQVLLDVDFPPLAPRRAGPLTRRQILSSQRLPSSWRRRHWNGVATELGRFLDQKLSGPRLAQVYRRGAPPDWTDFARWWAMYVFEGKRGEAIAMEEEPDDPDSSLPERADREIDRLLRYARDPQR